MKSRHTMPFGAQLLEAGGARFALWAPTVESVQLAFGPDDAPSFLDMQHDGDGWHRIDVAEARAGDSYRYRLSDGLLIPDPASRFNPADVHGASELMDAQTYDWQDGDWEGLAWREAVIYEMHVGALTPEGSFAAARERLPELARTGFTVIELMPLADFPGKRNWGYDGVLQFAPDASYGEPDELKAFVDAAHALGMAVLIDVVYNHFGPEGNYLHAYCPQFFNPKHQTPWGAAINYDAEQSATVRSFFIHNALYWVEEFHFDGLRMDAIHAIRDDSRPDIVHDVCSALRSGPGKTRPIHVVLENELNQASFLQRDEKGQLRAGTAQWNDDLHHAAHVLVTGETDGYYIDYATSPIDVFGRALAEGFVYQGQSSTFRKGERRGEPSTRLPMAAFVSFLQTHDQIGNRAFGDRIHTLADPVLLHAAYACLLLSPHVPMLFMGDEFAASTPFQYFCDFGPELAAAVSQGRRAEFSGFAAFADEAMLARIPDPNAESTYRASTLRWEERDASPHKEQLAAISALISIRREQLVPRLTLKDGTGRFWREGEALRVEWPLGDGSARLHLLAHFGEPSSTGDALPPGAQIYSTGMVEKDGRVHLARGAVRVSIQESAGG